MRNYGKLCTIIYDLDKPHASEDELDLYLKQISGKDALIIEPMCGSGRFYLPLLEKGYKVAGFDLSGEMLKACREKCESLNLEADVFEADITSFETTVKYDYAFIPIGSVSLLIEDSALFDGLTGVYNSLKEGGRFIFSFLNDGLEEEDILEWEESMRYEHQGMDIICLKKQKFNKEIGILDMKLLYELRSADELVEEEYQDFPMRLFDEAKIERFLLDIGFSVIEKINKDDEENIFSVFSCVK